MSEALEKRIAVLEMHIEAMEARAATAEHRLHTFRRDRSTRYQKLAEFIKERAPDLWPDYAAVSVNGSLYADHAVVEPSFEREMAKMEHRAEKAEESNAVLRAELVRTVEALQKIAKCDDDGLPESTPQAMVAIARDGLGISAVLPQ